VSKAPRFFKDDDFEFMTEIALGASAYRASEVGEVLATVARIKSGDYASWVSEWKATADRVRAVAAGAESGGHRLSAAEAYLRASTYYFNAAFFVMGTDGGDERLPQLWRTHRDCFEHAAALFDPPFERVSIPFDDGALEGWFFPAPGAQGARPLAILNNGSDGTVTDMWVQGAAPATARGYHALAFDGPGQGHALFEQGLHFRPDWEAVITPVVDYALSRADVDPERIALLGVSQAGYWVPRAVAFEHRIAAAVADPGVVDVSEAMTSQLGPLRKLLEEGKQEKFDSQMHLVERFSKSIRYTMKFRSLPYGTDSPYEMFKAAEQYRLEPEVARQIACPLLITDPENEQFWPGHSQRLAELVGERATVIPFTAAEGADGHCEPRAPVLRAQRIFDWLDERLGV
jgi:hypothetical protein